MRTSWLRWLSDPIVAVKVAGAAAFDGVAALPPGVGIPFEKRLRSIWRGDSRMQIDDLATFDRVDGNPREVDRNL